ncbi:hypothetical protein EXIGLDRAFT_833545 [Exidia glandulosa HHB12029]|uniref:Uncharacterized protein n=1 Tax=Exidia glandulosa HHB12029 TaxID=1314781 RepID=A0A166AZS7_EXIGL|nr:hypothetical protein EXIGLDRAFT_833545 [Exidia glandulosa HHB12029]
MAKKEDPDYDVQIIEDSITVSEAKQTATLLARLASAQHYGKRPNLRCHDGTPLQIHAINASAVSEPVRAEIYKWNWDADMSIEYPEPRTDVETAQEMFKDGNVAFHLCAANDISNMVMFCLLEPETEHFDGQSEDVVWLLYLRIDHDKFIEPVEYNTFELVKEYCREARIGKCVAAAAAPRGRGHIIRARQVWIDELETNGFRLSPDSHPGSDILRYECIIALDGA